MGKKMLRDNFHVKVFPRSPGDFGIFSISPCQISNGMEMTIEKLNETYIRIQTEPGIARELHDAFSFVVPGFRFTPAYKTGRWDGRIHMFNLSNRTIYAGLLSKVLQFAKDRDYSVNGYLGPSVECPETAQISSWAGSLEVPGITPHDYQIAAVRASIAASRALVVSPTGCHGAGDKVLMADGVFKNIEDITLGEFVMGVDGSPKEVLRLYSGEDELYEVSPKSNKSGMLLTGEHILVLKNSDKRKCGFDDIEEVSVSNFMKRSEYAKHCAKLIHNDRPLEISKIDPDTKLPPYFIGLYLGDGSSYNCQMTTSDDEIREEVSKVASSFGCLTKQNGYHLNIVKKPSTTKYNPINHEFKKLGLVFGTNSENRTKCEDRFIPKELFQSTISFRYELLAGLLDADGHLSKDGNYFEFISKSKPLADDVENLAISLGLVTSSRTKYNRRLRRDYYQVCIMGNTHLVPTRLPRKQAKPRKQLKIDGTRNNNPYRTSFTVKPKRRAKYYGIQVADHLYITNSGIITHNSGKSLIIYMLTRWYNKRTLIIVPTVGLVNQMESDFEKYNNPLSVQLIMGDSPSKVVKSQVVITTWQSIYKMPKAWFQQFDVAIGDECLHGETMITMADGSKKMISKIVPGDVVKTRNESTMEIENKKVVKLHRNISINERMFKITLSNGNSVRITGNHKVMLVDGSWKRADQLKNGDIISSIE